MSSGARNPLQAVTFNKKAPIRFNLQLWITRLRFVIGKEA